MAIEQLNMNIPLNVQQTINLLTQPTFTDQDIMQSFRVISNLYAGKVNLAIAEQMEKIVSKAEHCKPNFKGKFKFAERSIYAEYAQFGVEWCFEELVNTYYDKLAPLYANVQNPDLAEITRIILAELQMGLKRDVNRVAWFGDNTSTDGDYDWATGVWTRIPGFVGTGEIGYRANTASGGAISDQQAYEFLREVVSNAPAELRNFAAADKRIYISGNMWQQILNYLEDAAVSNGFISVFNDMLPGGIVASYRGIPIIVQDRWDQILSADFGLNDEHRLIYTLKENLVVATDLRPDARGSKAFTEIYREPLTKVLYVQGQFVFNTDVVFPQLLSVGY